MLQGLEMALAIYGLFGLVGGTLIISKTRVVRGHQARLLGALAILPLVLMFVFMFSFRSRDPRTLEVIEIVIAILVAVAVFTTGALLGVAEDENRPLAEEDEEVDYDEQPADADADADADPVAPDLVLTDSASTGSTGPESEHLDYFDTIAEHLEYFDMNPEHLDYFEANPAKPKPAGGDPLDDVGPDPARPDRGPPRPENRTPFR